MQSCRWRNERSGLAESGADEAELERPRRAALCPAAGPHWQDAVQAAAARDARTALAGSMSRGWLQLPSDLNGPIFQSPFAVEIFDLDPRWKAVY